MLWPLPLYFIPFAEMKGEQEGEGGRGIYIHVLVGQEIPFFGRGLTGVWSDGTTAVAAASVLHFFISSFTAWRDGVGRGGDGGVDLPGAVAAASVLHTICSSSCMGSRGGLWPGERGLGCRKWGWGKG